MNLDDMHARLVEQLDTTEPIRTAFADHPRHHYIPDTIWPRGNGLPLMRAADPERWASLVYANAPVTTQVNDGGSGVRNEPSSSSSAPQVMADMIAAACVEPGMRVLEIGTGSGWNAAVLASLVGPTGGVTTVEIDPKVAAHARGRLAGTGVRVVTGVMPSDPEVYDAVIATCAVTRVPREWIERAAPDAPLVVPWAPNPGREATPVVALRRRGRTRAVGPFVRDAAFMQDRTQRIPSDGFPGTGEEPTGKGVFPAGSVDLIDRDLLTRLVLTCPGVDIWVGGRPFEDGFAPVVALGSAGGWAYVWPDGSVTSGGREPVLETAAAAYRGLDDAGWPGLDAFSLEVEPQTGVCRVRAPFGVWAHPG